MGRLNKPAQTGFRYRSPEQTNARDLTPNLGEDVVASQSADAERIRKGLGADAKREYNRRMQQEAGGRAILRTAGRANLAGAALGAGYEAGRALDEKTGAGKKLVEDTKLGKMAERMAKPKEKVELSEDAKRRLDEEEVDRLTRETKAEKAAERAERKDKDDFDEGKAYKRGGRVAASKGASRADGIAQRGKTRGMLK
jgi:hypothetical protein